MAIGTDCAHRPDFGPGGLPPLPPLSPATLACVLTHRSAHARPAHGFEDRADDPSPDNEQCVVRSGPALRACESREMDEALTRAAGSSCSATQR
jgi:hypothetical protein